MSGAPVLTLAWRLLAGPGGGSARRIGRGRGRLIGAIVGVAVSLVPFVVVQQVAEAMIAGIATRFVETGTYHLQLVRRGAGDGPGGDPDRLVAALDGIEGVTLAQRERQGFALLSFGAERTGVTIRAVPHSYWDADAGVRRYLQVERGVFDLRLDRDTAPIVLGVEIARRLGVDPGDEVRMLTVRPVGEGRTIPRVSRFVVTGVVSTGYRDLDRLWVFIPLERGLRVIPDETARDIIGVKTADPFALPNPLFNRGLRGLDRRAGSRAAAMFDAVRAEAGPLWSVYTWYAAEQGRYLSFLTSRNLLAVVMAMIVLVAAVNISSALVFLVVEKETDIAILRALGVPRSRIAWALVVDGAIIGAAAGTFGTLAGAAIARWINELLALVERIVAVAAGRAVSIVDAEFYLERIPVQILFAPLAGAVLLALCVSVGAAFLPARRAARIAPDRILRRHG